MVNALEEIDEVTYFQRIARDAKHYNNDADLAQYSSLIHIVKHLK